jgi:hypothetical protein
MLWTWISKSGSIKGYPWVRIGCNGKLFWTFFTRKSRRKISWLSYPEEGLVRPHEQLIEYHLTYMKDKFIALRNFYAMKTCGGVEVCVHAFAYICANWRQGHFTSGERSSGTLWIRGWVVFWGSLAVVAKRMPRIEPRSANLRHEICRCCGSENKSCARFPVLTSTTKVKVYEHAYCRSNGMNTWYLVYVMRRTVYQWHFGRCYIKRLERP